MSAAILYLTFDGLSDHLGQSQILPYLSGLADRGYDITVVSFEKKIRFREGGAEITAIIDRHAMTWIPLRYHRSPPVLSTLYDLRMLSRTTSSLYKKRKFDIVHCRSYVTSLIGLRLRRRYKAKFIFDMRGFWADERVEGGIWNLNNPFFKLIYRYFKRKEKEFLREADHVVVLTEQARTVIKSWGIDSLKTSVVPTCVDMDLFNPDRITASDVNLLRRDLRIDPSSFVLIYVGSWGTWYLTDEVLNFFSMLKGMEKSSILLILTPDLVELKDYPHSSSVLIREVHRTKVPLYLKVASAGVCFVKPTFSKSASSATKMAEACAMNLQVVTNAGWGDIDMLEKTIMPLLKVAHNKSDYSSIARSLLMKEVPRGARHLLLGTFDLPSGIRNYDGIYRSLSVGPANN